jgi:hypothetical protein
MRAMKPTDSNMDDARVESRAVVPGDRDPAVCDLGELGLTEANGF